MIYILLPCYNEYKNLLPLIKKINLITKRNNLQINIVLVNDGSIDETHKNINFLKKISKNKIIYIKQRINLGLNMALLNGFEKIISVGKKNDIVITLDSDNTHPVNIIPQMNSLLTLENFDIVIASRFQTGGKVKGLSHFRTSLSIAARIIFKLIINIRNVNDYTCNYRAYNLNIYEIPFILRYDKKIGVSKIKIGTNILKTLNLILRNF